MLQIGPWCPLCTSVIVSSCMWYSRERLFTHLAVCLKVVDLGPGVIASTNDILALLWVHRNTSNWVWHLDLLNESASIKSTVEVDLVSGRDCKYWITSTNIRGIGADLKLIELDRPELACYRQLLDHLALLQVPPTNDFIIARGHKDIWIMGPDNGLDCPLVNSWANLESFVCWNDSWVARVALGVAVGDWCHRGEIENAELLLKASSCDELAVVWWESDSTDNVVVLDGIESLSGVGIPDASKGAS